MPRDQRDEVGHYIDATLTNGHSNGHHNGPTYDGFTNGDTNVHTNTHVNGYTNGYTNSNTNDRLNGNGRLPAARQLDSKLTGYTSGRTKHATPRVIQTESMPIAIIGMGCRFPGDTTSPEKLWRLCTQARSAWSEIPQDRYNQKAFFHPDGESKGTANVNGGHFLTEDISLFDAPFFNITPEEAKAMDPQLRLQLETSYEALESAGLPLEKIAGSQTSVYGSLFTRDYQDSIMRDTEIMPRYFVTGNGTAMLSNRLSYFYDFKGPSLTVDTGCSTSLVALHLACQSLRTGEATMSLVGGSNIILNPDMLIGLSNMGFLGPGGRSYAFDHRGEGYGRGEGAACLVIKPLEDALRDNDPIRAVIRETAVNSDGLTKGVTMPSQEAHEALIRSAYRNAGLDPAETGYVEAHGTGTKTGDPLEMGAISSVFAQSRTVEAPLYVGSVKTNVGHLEAASGLAGVIKAAMAVERAIIPPNINFEKQNEKLSLETKNVKIPQIPTIWPTDGVRRASVNSLGYGGTNAHIILENVENLSNTMAASAAVKHPNGSHPHEQSPNMPLVKDSPSNETDGSDTGLNLAHQNGYELKLQRLQALQQTWESSDRPMIFQLSAKQEDVAQQMKANLTRYLQTRQESNERSFLDNLAYTLGQRRSAHPWSQPVRAGSISELIKGLEDPSAKPIRSSKAPRLGFVFTGQGAQWAQMGKELTSAYPIFKDTLDEADRYLLTLGCSWSLKDELARDTKTSQVGTAKISQPLCTAVQIGLVRVLRSWGIIPSAVTGHSSGEIAAGYASGAIDLEFAMAIAYFRGLVAVELQKKFSNVRGGMLAVGLSQEETEKYIQRVTRGDVMVACVNSPASVTVSGDVAGLDELQPLIEADRAFARRLNVDVAYHSHHMEPAADYYSECLRGYKPTGEFGDIVFSSSVTGGRISSAKELHPGHWVRNIVQPVLFNDSLLNLCVDAPSSDATPSVDLLIEVGPHSALAGPIRQIMKCQQLKDLKIPYSSCLVRKENAVETMQSLAGLLLSKGYPVDLSQVNFPITTDNLQALPDLPSYPWNHKVRHWHESRLNKRHRLRRHPRHDLLGLPTVESNPLAPSWRHFVRLAELPWVSDHVVQSSVLYPAAGYICMAIEAVRQSSATKLSGYRLRDVDILKALVVPNTSDGVELHLSLRSSSDRLPGAGNWQEFHVYSIDEDDQWSEHCQGFISSMPKAPKAGTLSKFRDHDRTCAKSLKPDLVYQGLRKVGINHGPAFQNLTEIATAPGKSRGVVTVGDMVSLMPNKWQHDHVLHPTTLDAVFVAIYPAFSGESMEHETAMVPKFFKSISISSCVNSTVAHQFDVRTTVGRKNLQSVDASICVSDLGQDSAPVIEIDGFVCTSVGINAAEEKAVEATKLCFGLRWEHDISFMQSEDFHRLFRVDRGPPEAIVDSDLQHASFLIIKDTIEAMTTSDKEGLTPHHKAMYEWMKTQYDLGQQGKLDLQTPEWLQTRPAMKQHLFKKVQEAGVNGKLLLRVGHNLLSIFRKEADALDVMMEEKLLHTYYGNAIGLDRIYTQTAAIIDRFAHKNPSANILEIGAGTGGLTLPVLQALSGNTGINPRFSNYDYTDISAGFFETAKGKFSEWSDLMSFKKFDVESDAAAQGVLAGTYDLIVACDVLHATRSMDVTMANVRKLLKPDGYVLIVEGTRDTPHCSLIFGTLPGWWLGQEEARRLSPKLTVESWRALLKRTGFNDFAACLQDQPAGSSHIYSAMLAKVSSKAPQLEYPPVSIVHGESVPPSAWLEELKAGIAAITGQEPSLGSLENHDVHGKVCIFLGEIDQCILAHLGAEEYLQIRRFLGSAKGVLWVSRGGAMEAKIPEASMITGLLRTLRAENSGTRYTTLDLDARTDLPTFSPRALNAIFDTFKATFNYDLEETDLEYAERDGLIHIPRILEDRISNDALLSSSQPAVPTEQPFYQDGRPLRMHIGTPGMLDTLRFEDDASFNEPLPGDFVEVEPKAFGLNFRDVMVAMGQLNETVMGYECSGVITRVGANITNFNVGDHVCTMTKGHYANYIRLPGAIVGHVPQDMPFEKAASLPMVFCTAYYALYDIGRLEKDETVLIHAAAGGVGQAAIMLARLAGAKIFVTAGTNEKRAFLTDTYGIPPEHIFSSRDISFAKGLMAATDGKGVDVVLNCLAGELLQETWNCVGELGRFVEIGKRDLELNNRLEMAPFVRSVSFTAVDLTYLLRSRHRVISRILRHVMELLSQDAIQAVQPITVYPISEIGRAFRLMQAGKHQGKVVIQPTPGDAVMVLKAANASLFNADASYMIVGGLGGIGRSVSRWMVNRGAKNLVLVSRSAETQPNVQQLTSELKEAGCRVAVHSCDVADTAQFVQMLQKVGQAMPPIRGVIQGAMVLKDCVFEYMPYEGYQAALRPKVQGTWNLHNELSKKDLDFFVMLSSVVGVAGNPSQASYGAAGTFLDAMASFRAAQGLPAVSLDFGMIQSVGYVAENDAVAERLKKMGHQAISEPEMLALVQMAIEKPFGQHNQSQIITGLQSGVGNSSRDKDLKFMALRLQNRALNAGQSNKDGRGSLSDALTSAKALPEAIEVITKAIATKLSEDFMIPADDIDPARPVSSFGVDSLVAVELRNWLLSQSKAEVSVFDVVQSKSLTALSTQIALRSKYISASLKGTPDAQAPAQE